MTNSYEEEGTQTQDPSKSERKRQMHALQAMGERLVTLPQSDLNLITISDERLSDAIALARRITARSGLKRQLQYIGKLMRSVDATAIEEGLAYLDQRNATSAAEFHRVEAARDKLIEQGDAGIRRDHGAVARCGVNVTASVDSATSKRNHSGKAKSACQKIISVPF
jgi:ribosome-associated protein